MLISEFFDKYTAVFAPNSSGDITPEDLQEFVKDITETFGTGNFKGAWVDGPMQAGEYWISGNKIWKTKQAFNSATAPTQANAYWELVLDTPPSYTDDQAIAAAKTNIGTGPNQFAEGSHSHAALHQQNTDTGTYARSFQIGQGTAGSKSSVEAAGMEDDINQAIKPKGNAHVLYEGINYVTAVNKLLEITPEGKIIVSGSGVNSFSVPSAFGSTYFISPSGNDSTGIRGRIDKPYLTLQAALNNSISQPVGENFGWYDTFVCIGGTFAGMTSNSSRRFHTVVLLGGAKIAGEMNTAGTDLSIVSDGSGEMTGNINAGGFRTVIKNLKKFTGNITDAGPDAYIAYLEEFTGVITWRPGDTGTVANCKKVTFNGQMPGMLYLVNIELCICVQIGVPGHPLSINARRVNFQYGHNVLMDARYNNNFFQECNFKQVATGVSFINDQYSGVGGSRTSTFNNCNFLTDCEPIKYPGGNKVEIDFCRTNFMPFVAMTNTNYGAAITEVGDYNRYDAGYTVGY